MLRMFLNVSTKLKLTGDLGHRWAYFSSAFFELHSIMCCPFLLESSFAKKLPWYDLEIHFCERSSLTTIFATSNSAQGLPLALHSGITSGDLRVSHEGQGPSRGWLCNAMFKLLDYFFNLLSNHFEIIENHENHIAALSMLSYLA